MPITEERNQLLFGNHVKRFTASGILHNISITYNERCVMFYGVKLYRIEESGPAVRLSEYFYFQEH
jgi:hypothetical protein